MRSWAKLAAASFVVLLACRSEPRMMQVELSVEGMFCESCVEGISYEVGRLEGVRSVAVDLEAETASVVFVEGAIEAAAIEAAIDKLGYEATPVTVAPAPE